MAVTQEARFGTNRWSAGTDPWPARGGWATLLDKITTVAAIYAEGTFAARPAFNAAKFGQVYWATDQQRLYIQSKTAWVEASPVGGGGPGSMSRGRAGLEGSSRIGARADHTHPDNVWGTRPMLNGSADPIGTYSTNRPTKVNVGFTSQAADGHGFFQVPVPETATCIVGALATVYYSDSGSIQWYPVLRGDHCDLGTITFQARRISDGGELAGASIRCMYAIWYQIATPA